MRLFVYDMLVNVNVIYYVQVCEQARWARSAGNSAIENLCIIIIILLHTLQASLSATPPEDSGIMGYAINGALLISMHISTKITPSVTLSASSVKMVYNLNTKRVES